MRLNSANIIMHESMIWLQRHTAQRPTLTCHVDWNGGWGWVQTEISADLCAKRLVNQHNLCHVEALEKDDSGKEVTDQILPLDISNFIYLINLFFLKEVDIYNQSLRSNQRVILC